MTVTTVRDPAAAVRSSSRTPVAVLTGLALVLTATAVGALLAGGLRPGTAAFVERTVLWSCVVGALLVAGVLLFSLAGVRHRGLAALAGLVASLALLLPALLVSQTDASSEANGFAGCGTFLRPTPIATGPGIDGAECASARSRQRTTTVVLALPSAAILLLTLVHAAGGARRPGR